MIEIILKLFQQPKPIFVNSSTSPYLTIKQGLYLEKESSRNTHKSKRTTNQQQSPVCTLVSLFVCVFICVILASYSPHLLHKETLRLDLHRTARQTSKQTNKQTNKQANKQTNKQTRTHTRGHTHRQTDRQTDRQAGMRILTNKTMRFFAHLLSCAFAHFSGNYHPFLGLA